MTVEQLIEQLRRLPPNTLAVLWINEDKNQYSLLSHENMVKELWELVQRAKPIVESDARMVADLTRFAPLPSEAQEKHDTTEYPSETWLSDFEAFKKKWVMK